MLTNSSQIGRIKTYSSNNGQFAYLGAPPSLPHSLDYTASTYALQSICRPVTRECFAERRIYGFGAFYDCPFAIEGPLDTGQTNTLKWAYFTDSSGRNNHTNDGIGNPYYYAAIMSVNQNSGRSDAIAKDPQVEYGGHGSTIFAVLCSATVYDLNDTMIDGNVRRFIAKPSNNSVANILQQTQRTTEVANPYILQASALAAWNSNSSTEMAEKFALAYMQAALAITAGAYVPAPYIDAQGRREMLVARVPKSPLYFFYFMRFLFVFLGIILAGVALFWLNTSDTGEVQARLSIAGLVAAKFETATAHLPSDSVERLFEEYHDKEGARIGIPKLETGGWGFVQHTNS